MAAIVLASGTKGKRFALPNSRIMIHQPSMEGIEGQATDVRIYAEELLRIRELLSRILAETTGQSYEKTDLTWSVTLSILTPLQAVEYGLIDNVLSSRESASAGALRLAPAPLVEAV